MGRFLRDLDVYLHGGEADWTLDLVERLFEHLIVDRATDQKMCDSIDAKIKAAGRRVYSGERLRVLLRSRPGRLKWPDGVHMRFAELRSEHHE
jgi:hypothetical protein